MKNAIVTSSDSNYGDFLADHWLKSLKTNTNLHNIDIIVLDYGLTNKQLSRLKGAKIIKCIKDGHVTSLRYRDLLNFLQSNIYDQVLMCDGGDMIFQRDISHLFYHNKNKWRAVEEEVSMAYDQIYQFKIKDKKVREDVINYLMDKNSINGGFILGPADKFIDFCKFYLSCLTDLSSYGIDQSLISYCLKKDNYIKLDQVYNFPLHTGFSKQGYYVKDGLFYTSAGELIYVVHNNGGTKLTRGMLNFGYRSKPTVNIFTYSTRFLISITNPVVKSFTKLVSLLQSRVGH